MSQESKIKLFQEQSIRSHWNDEQEQWYFSVIDVVAVLTGSANPRDYWYKMKIRVKNEGSFEPSTVCRQLKMQAPDGKQRLTDCADTEGVLRIIQSIPSPMLRQAQQPKVQPVYSPRLRIKPLSLSECSKWRQTCPTLRWSKW